MIRKDTIEDKILQLQDRKRALAKRLIADDATFVKTLTREDVEYCLVKPFGLRGNLKCTIINAQS
jgi:SNF2 family DNA or RNA helicase